MPAAEKHYRWEWDLASSPEALWPLVSDTDRFNRDCGFPAVKIVPPAELGGPPTPGARRLRTRHFGLLIEWDERPFEWIVNRSFGVERVFHHGPFQRILARCDLAPHDPSGSRATYQVWLTPANALGTIALAVGGVHWQFERPFERVFRQYDRIAAAGGNLRDQSHSPKLSPGGTDRLAVIRDALRRDPRQSAALVDLLADHVVNADDLAGQRIRAYELADRWRTDRRQTLQTCLRATRAGLLDLRWDAICPNCRGAKAIAGTLSQLPGDVHCDTCQIDFTSEFDRSVELAFTPNPAVRRVPRTEYCVGGPQITPHAAIQQIILPGETRAISFNLPPGRYRVRSKALENPWPFAVVPEAGRALSLRLGGRMPSALENELAPDAEITFVNPSAEPQVVVIEHLAWSDQATVASEVTSLQLFRDLFVRELLRPGTQLSVGSLTVVFTDLKGSTQLYRNIGDAPAFSRVLTHFDLLKEAIASEGGAIVKTMGDAVMAIFPRPAPALRAMVTAQRALALAQSASPWSRAAGAKVPPEPLTLKVGLHHGPCIVINQNECLDYFGTTVNVTARLCSLSTGTDLILSQSVRDDPEVAALLKDPGLKLRAAGEQTQLRGLADEVFNVYRVRRG